MVSKYPTQHAPWDSGGGSQSAGSHGGGSQGFMGPIPPLPPGAVQGIPPLAGTAAEAAAGGILFRIGLRAIPYIGTGIALYELYQWAKSQVIVPGDWTVVCTGAGSNPTRFTSGNFGCGNVIQGPFTPGGAGYAAYANFNNVGVNSTSVTASQVGPLNPSTLLCQTLGCWVKQKGTSTNKLTVNKTLYRHAYSYPYSFAVPEEFPILQPMPDLKPPSIRPGTGTPPNPDGGEPDNDPDGKPKPAPTPTVWPGQGWPPLIVTPGDVVPPDVVITPKPPPPAPSTNPDPDQGGSPSSGPGTSPEPSTGGSPGTGTGGDVDHVPPTYEDAPPTEREKERKINLHRKGGAASHGLRVIVNVATEGLDFVDTLYKGMNAGLPKDERAHCKPHDYKCKLAFLYDHWDDPRFDAAKWVEAWVNNQMEDYLYGKLGQAVGKATGKLNLTQGLNHALAQHQQLIRNLVKQYEDAIRKAGGHPDQSKLLPELVIDETNGTATVEWPLLGVGG